MPNLENLGAVKEIYNTGIAETDNGFKLPNKVNGELVKEGTVLVREKGQVRIATAADKKALKAAEKEATKDLTAAKSEAQKIIDDAQAQASKIIEDAQAQVEAAKAEQKEATAENTKTETPGK